MMEERHGFDTCTVNNTTLARNIPAIHRREDLSSGLCVTQSTQKISNWRYHNFSWENNGTFTFERWCQWRYEEEENWGYFMGLNQKEVVYGHKFNVRQQAGYFCDETGRSIANRIFRFDELQSSLEEIQTITELRLRPVSILTACRTGGDEVRRTTPSTSHPRRRKFSERQNLWTSDSGRQKVKFLQSFNCETVPNYAYSR